MTSQHVTLRLDDRLIHGQVIFDWLRQLEPCTVLVLQQGVDETQRALYRSALPERYGLWVGHPAEAATQLENTGSGPVLALLAGVPELAALVQAGYRPQEVILGALGFAPGKQRVSNQVYLSPQEREVLLSLACKGMRIVIQARYQDSPRLWLAPGA